MVSFYTLSTLSLVGFTGCVWIYLKTKMKDHEKLKSTTCYKEALAAMRSHNGAIKYLGQPIEDRTMYVSSVEDISDEIRKTEVNVEVKGSKNFGRLYFWVNQYISNPANFYVDEVQLQIGTDDSKRLIIQKSKFEEEMKSKTVNKTENIPKEKQEKESNQN